MKNCVFCPFCGRYPLLEISFEKLQNINITCEYCDSNIQMATKDYLKRISNSSIIKINKCSLHQLSFTSFCKNCKLNLCKNCHQNHKEHKVVIIPDIDYNSIIKKIKEGEQFINDDLLSLKQNI